MIVIDQAAAQRAIQSLYDLLGKRIAAERRARGITQADLARAVGLTRTSMTNIEAGRQRPPLHVTVALAQALGLELSELLSSTYMPQLAPEVPSSTKALRRALQAAQDSIAAVLDQLPPPQE
jgi:transcriptional regulator with XRE-family HTH domain